MICPYCRMDHDRVLETRSCDGGLGIRRRRECIECGRRFTSFERLEAIPVHVLKRSGNREPFDADKVRQSIRIACRKRPVSIDQIDNIVARVEMKALHIESRELSSVEIGDTICQELERLDHVAFIRFSSVYKEYSSSDHFIETIKNLQTNFSV